MRLVGCRPDLFLGTQLTAAGIVALVSCLLAPNRIRAKSVFTVDTGYRLVNTEPEPMQFLEAMTCTLHCDPTAPHQARTWAQQQLDSAPAADTIPATLAEDVLLCISELVTNALQASCDFATIEIAVDTGRVRVVVTDNGTGWPTPQRPGPSDPTGRGLMIISALADRWGVESLAASKTVWAELTASA